MYSDITTTNARPAATTAYHRTGEPTPPTARTDAPRRAGRPQRCFCGTCNTCKVRVHVAAKRRKRALAAHAAKLKRQQRAAKRVLAAAKATALNGNKTNSFDGLARVTRWLGHQDSGDPQPVDRGPFAWDRTGDGRLDNDHCALCDATLPPWSNNLCDGCAAKPQPADSAGVEPLRGRPLRGSGPAFQSFGGFSDRKWRQSVQPAS